MRRSPRAWIDDETAPDWERPGPTPGQRRADLLLGAVVAALNLWVLLLLSDQGAFGSHHPGAREYWLSAAAGLVLCARRRYPLITLGLASLVFVVLGTGSAPLAAATVTFQAAYSMALYTAVAWGRDRLATWWTVAVVLLVMAVWVALDWTVLHGFDQVRSNLHGVDSVGPWSPMTAAVLLNVIVNLLYFGGSLGFGRASWRAALRRRRLAEQAETIREQSEQLAEQAVVAERLRLARELHDSVGHHFTGVGMLAGGVRRVLEQGRLPQDRSQEGQPGDELRLGPEATRRVLDSLAGIESSTRTGVVELQTVLRVLREEEPEDAHEPGLADLAELFETVRRTGLVVEVHGEDVLEEASSALFPSAQLAFYRMVQESLTNVLKHSGARRAVVGLRRGRDPDRLEAEVTDDGRPLRGGRAVTSASGAQERKNPSASGAERGTPSTGHGLTGLTERARAHGGDALAGPRTPGPGWSLRFWIPVRRD